jgi:hypothetical protein
MYVCNISVRSEFALHMPASESELVRLLSALNRGEATREQVINELAAWFQLSAGAAVQALAEIDKAAAQQLGTRLKGRLDAAMAEIGRRSGGDRAPAQPSRFADRDDDVLRREYAIATRLLITNGSVKTADLIALSRRLQPEITDEAVTAHLKRIVEAGHIAKTAKGRYERNDETQAHRDGLAVEFEARRLDIPINS